VFTNEHGLVIRPSGTPTPPTHMPQVPLYDGPTGETLHTDLVHFTARAL
jgi:hypothetical protein